MALPEDLMEDLFQIEAGRRLGVSALEVRAVPYHYLTAVRVQLQAESLERAATARRVANARQKQQPAKRR